MRKGYRAEKARTIDDLEGKFKLSSASLVADYRGLNVAKVTSLRRRLSKENIEFRVIKNTLARIALERLGLDEANAFFEGPSAVAFSHEDPTTAAKILLEFARENKEFQVKGGVIEGRVVGSSDVKTLSELPSREVLLGRVIGGAAAPLTGFVSLLQAPLRNLVYVLSAVHDKMEGSPSGA
jgi:large subunit ribosomal protein L10